MAMSRIRIGVVGCGAIAQVQHLPNLIELDEEFDQFGLGGLKNKHTSTNILCVYSRKEDCW